MPIAWQDLDKYVIFDIDVGISVISSQTEGDKFNLKRIQSITRPE